MKYSVRRPGVAVMVSILFMLSTSAYTGMKVVLNNSPYAKSPAD